jgi:hypothetical protein
MILRREIYVRHHRLKAFTVEKHVFIAIRLLFLNFQPLLYLTCFFRGVSSLAYLREQDSSYLYR